MGALALEWGVASRPIAGELRSGDAHAVKAFDGGALVAAVDGLGHGAAAADAAALAVQVLEEQPELPVDVHFDRCHRRLKGSRGVVMSIARFDAERAELTWSGIGNVEGVLVRADPGAPKRRESLLTLGGVVGEQISGVRVSALPLGRGDVLMFATDGLKPEVVGELDTLAEPQACAERALKRWAKGTDDALVVVARWVV